MADCIGKSPLCNFYLGALAEFLQPAICGLRAERVGSAIGRMH